MIREDPKVIKGAALALGIRLEPVGNSLTISLNDLERLRRKLGLPDNHAVPAAG